MFDVVSRSASAGGEARTIFAALSAIALHAMAVLAVVAIAVHEPADVSPSPIVPPQITSSIVWLNNSPEGRSGGGGGNRNAAPPRRAARPGNDRLTVPVRTFRAPIASETPAEFPGVIIDALPLALGAETVTGVIDVSGMPTGLSRGPGDGDGAGSGRGSGDGDRLGPGYGSDVFEPGGTGVSPPVALTIERPRYTAAALQARVHGAVLVQCIVNVNGACTDVRVVRSLDPRFGLDQEAVVAAGRWRFKPGTRYGQAVPVRVSIELSFEIR